MLATVTLVVAFGRSTNLAAAYGVAVVSTMVITTILAYVVARERFHWRRSTAIGVTVLFLGADLAFFGATIVKVPHGGWLPLVVTEEQPHVAEAERVEVTDLGLGFFRIILHFGFMESVHVPRELRRISVPGLDFPPAETTYFLGKETVLATQRPGMALWRERLFVLMARNARAATVFFHLPPNHVFELGSQVEI